ncbi:M48 family metallopeptidase [bacterium]|nr:M48 family metallopeptidase [bacterium]
METQITYTKARTARARLRGACLVMTIPRHWPRAEQDAAIAKFTKWGQKQSSALAALPVAPSAPPLSIEALTDMVARINDETVQVHYAGVRIGNARYTRLAQVNLKTKILTFSRHAIDGMPERALRYLILHELAHLIHPNHSSAYWAVVGKHMPDYREQRKIAQHHFALAAQRGEVPTAPAPEKPAAPAKLPELQPGPKLPPGFEQLSLF